MRKFSLDLKKVTQDTETLAMAVGLANAEGQLVPESSREEILDAVWAADRLVESLAGLLERSEKHWEGLVFEDTPPRGIGLDRKELS